MNYSEETKDANINKKNYLDGLERLIAFKQDEVKQSRVEYIKSVFENPTPYREDFKKMLGWPLVNYEKKGLPTVKKTKLAEEDGFTIYRMQFEILDGLEMSGLYFEMQTTEKKPLVLVQHGGLGTPELISGVYEGDTANYNHMLERVISYGAHAFAPQLLLWNKPLYEIEFDRQSIDARLKRVGSSITAVELYGLMRILDYFETQDNVSNFGMVGLSYGGFYTLFLSAIDERIKSAISCSFFNSRDNYPWLDWTWFGFADKFDDAEIACMVYPRKLCIEVGEKDELFNVKGAKESFEILSKLCEGVGEEWLKFITFDGGHEFCKDDGPIEELVKHIS